MPAATLSRRRFLQSATAVTAGIALSPAITSCGLLRSDNGLQAMASDFDGRVIFPGEPGFQLAAWPNNANYADVVPLAVAECATVPDVVRCVRWAKDSGLPFAVRSGGHNYAGFSTTDGLLIDVKSMNRVSVDQRAGTVTAEGGANNQLIAQGLTGYNLAIPSGRCPTVGVVGLVTGGGWGFPMNRYGTASDSLISTEMVLADGSVKQVDAKNEPDLFWGIRGAAGGNLGINTSMTIRGFELPKPITTFNISWPPRSHIELLSAMLGVQVANPLSMSSRTKTELSRAVSLPKPEDLYISTLGIYWGREEELRELLAPVFSIEAPREVDIRELPYPAARSYLATDDPYGLYESKSSYVGETMPIAGLEESFRWMKRWPGASRPQPNLGLYFAFGGKVRELASDATAYVHRNANFLFQVEPEWTPLDKPATVSNIRAWLADYYQAMQSFVLPQSYQNFPDRDLPNYAQAYYGSNLPRLSQVKTKYDPTNLFRFPQSVPLSK